jgi:hypothetical protein
MSRKSLRRSWINAAMLSALGSLVMAVNLSPSAAAGVGTI